MKKLKVLSLFNGMNCIGMALKSLNIEAELYCSEIDKYANQISSLLFPEAVNLGCVKTVKVSDIGKIDLLVARMENILLDQVLQQVQNKEISIEKARELICVLFGVVGQSEQCTHENEVQRQGDGFVYTVCGDCGEDLD